MSSVGKAISYGAVTIINAISCGFGAALGVDLQTEVTVKLTDEPGLFRSSILSDLEESTFLVEKTAIKTLKIFNLQGKYGAVIETRSNIPIARGLKSSSAAANAVVLAVLDALNKEMDDLDVVNLGVNAALEAGVSITGAFDDACASYFGNLVVTDNYERRILKQFYLKDDYSVLIFVPTKKMYTFKTNVARMKIFRKEVKTLHDLVLKGKYWSALTLNGLLYSAVLGYDPKPAIEALVAGALSAGLSGTGPAIAAVVPQEKKSSVIESWREFEGSIIETRINSSKSHSVR